MNVDADTLTSGPARPRPLARTRIAVGATGAAILGLAPHVLHHAGPLAGAALLGGSSGNLLFAALGFAAAIPLLVKLRRRSGSWRLPGAVLALMAVVFAFSALVLGPAIAGSGDRATDEPASPPATTQPAPDAHQAHHQ